MHNVIDPSRELRIAWFVSCGNLVHFDFVCSSPQPAREAARKRSVAIWKSGQPRKSAETEIENTEREPGSPS